MRHIFDCAARALSLFELLEGWIWTLKISSVDGVYEFIVYLLSLYDELLINLHTSDYIQVVR